MSSKFVNEIPCWSVNRLHVDTLTKSQKQKCGNEMSSFTCFFLKMKFDTWRKIFKIVTLHKGRQESGSLLCGFNIFWWQEKRARLWCWLDGRKFPFCLRNFASSFLEFDTFSSHLFHHFNLLLLVEPMYYLRSGGLCGIVSFFFLFAFLKVKV